TTSSQLPFASATAPRMLESQPPGRLALASLFARSSNRESVNLPEPIWQLCETTSSPLGQARKPATNDSSPPTTGPSVRRPSGVQYPTAKDGGPEAAVASKIPSKPGPCGYS